jgi:hypothetical protein
MTAVPHMAHFAQYERTRANSYDTPNAPNTTASRDEFVINPNQFVTSPAGSGSASPVSPRPLAGPYRNPALNVSAPVLHPQARAPYMTNRSVTAPPGKRLAFAPNLSVHTTWPAAVYDRRSEPATCNKLTPALAQRIKCVRSIAIDSGLTLPQGRAECLQAQRDGRAPHLTHLHSCVVSLSCIHRSSSASDFFA